MSGEVRVKSAFHEYREHCQPKVPKVLQAQELAAIQQPVPVKDAIKELFPNLCKTPPAVFTFEESISKQSTQPPILRIGCVLSGGQAAGGHNVIVGIYEQIKRRNPNSQLFGFLNGPIGIIKGNYVEIREDTISFFKNRGGFDMIRSGRNKIELPEEFESSLKNCQHLKLDGLVVIGGDDSNTNACLLAEYFQQKGCPTKVVGCPKTIDGDLKNQYIEVSFGFDTACKTYSELIGNIMTDTISNKKYWHFIRLMGRSASHITLECTLLTRPNYSFIGEEIEQKKITLAQLVDELVEIIVQRSNYKGSGNTKREQAKNYGIVLVPEGLIEFVCEVKSLIQEINNILAKELKDSKLEINQLFEQVCKYLTPESAKLLQYLPRTISEQLLLDRDPHGNVQVAKIETEKLLIDLCTTELEKRRAKGEYTAKFMTQSHYFGYEGRCAFPTNFDGQYCYCLGVNAGILIEKGFTGVMSCIRNLQQDPDKWIPCAVPLVTMMHTEIRKGMPKPVIEKALTDLKGDLFKYYCNKKKIWAIEDFYRGIGPIQFEFQCKTPYLVKGPVDEEECHPIQRKDEQGNDQFSPFFRLQKENLSDLDVDRIKNPPELPSVLQSDYRVVKETSLEYQTEEIKRLCEKHFKYAYTECSQMVEVLRPQNLHADHKPLPRRKGLKIGICFNGRNAPGNHNIIEGLLRFCQKSDSQLFGFLNGTQGLFSGNYIEIVEDEFKVYVNSGGNYYLGRSTDKIRDQDELEKTKTICEKLKLNGLVLVGASHTLTDSLILTNFFLEKNVATRVLVVPSTINNNVGHHMLESVVGFDSAAKVFCQLIGNLMIDAASAVKYFYFVKVMGSGPSHLVLECALQTNPNIALIGEEIAKKGWNLNDVINYIADVIAARSSQKKDFGVLLVPEGLLTYLPEFKELIEQLNSFFLKLSKNESEAAYKKILSEPDYITKIISPWSAARFQTLPEFTQKQLLLERNITGEIQLSQIETERLLARLVEIELKARKKRGQFNGSFSPVCTQLGYQGRGSKPTLFDCELASTYGFLAGALIEANVTGYCTTARGVNGAIKDWHVGAIPLINMTQIKTQKAYVNGLPVVGSAEVNLNSRAFQQYKKNFESWQLTDYYCNSGPTQFYGIRSYDRNLIIKYEYENYLNLIKEIENLTQHINSQCRFGTHEDLLRITINHLKNLEHTLQLIKNKYN